MNTVLDKNLDDFVETLIADWADTKRMYIAVMPNTTSYDLEVETIPEDTIGGTFPAFKSLKKTRELADALDAKLTARGIYVCKTREEWEEFDDDE